MAQVPMPRDIDPKTWVISPSQLNQFNNCEYQWYLDKMMQLRQPANANMTRGTAFHEAAENIWKYDIKGFRDDSKELDKNDTLASLEDLPFNLFDQPPEARKGLVTPFGKSFRAWGRLVFEEAWAKHRKQVDQDVKRYDEFHDTSIRAFMHYVDKIILQVEAMVDEKGNTYASAYQRAKPFLREKKLYSQSKLEMGLVDYIFNTQHGRLIGDWKTGHPVGSGHSPEYYNQLAFYAYLDESANGDRPSFVEINYAVHGLTLRYDVTPEMIEGIRLQIDHMRNRIAEAKANENSFTKNTKFKYCKSCFFGEMGFCDRNGEKV